MVVYTKVGPVDHHTNEYPLYLQYKPQMMLLVCNHNNRLVENIVELGFNQKKILWCNLFKKKITHTLHNIQEKQTESHLYIT